ncbi:hypothetical protein [Pedobacter steynii]
MFISYAMNVAEMITIAVAAYVLGVELTYENLWMYIAIIMVGVFLFAPFNYRYSRYFYYTGLHQVSVTFPTLKLQVQSNIKMRLSEKVRSSS